MNTMLSDILREILKETDSQENVSVILEKLARQKGYDNFKEFFGDDTFTKKDKVIEIFKEFTFMLKNDKS